MIAHLRKIRISPKKANLIADLVRGKMVSEALDFLKFTPKKGAKILRRAINSAAANAENNFKQNRDQLYLKEILVTDGPTYKRSVSASRGRIHPIRKKTSHVTVRVEVKAEEKTKKSKTPKP